MRIRYLFTDFYTSYVSEGEIQLVMGVEPVRCRRGRCVGEAHLAYPVISAIKNSLGLKSTEEFMGLG